MEINFDIQSMTMASSVRETRGRKAKLDVRLQQLSIVVTITNKTLVDKSFRLPSNILLNQICILKHSKTFWYANKKQISKANVLYVGLNIID